MLPIIIASIESPEDRDMMTAFYMDYKGRMYTEARKFMNTQEDVEDMVYEALTRIIDKMDLFRELRPEQRSAYAITTVRHLSVMQLEKNAFRNHLALSELDTDYCSVFSEPLESAVGRQLLSDKIRAVWTELPQRYQMLLEQKYILRSTDAEMAEFFGVEQSSIRMYLTRARRKLMQKLKDHNIAPQDW